MTVDLAKDVEDFLEEQTRKGACVNPSELVNDVLRSVRVQQEKPFTVTAALEEWLLEAADKPHSALTAEDFAAIRRRLALPVQ